MLLTFILKNFFLAVLSDPDKRLEYDLNGNYEIDKYTLRVSISWLVIFWGITWFNSMTHFTLLSLFNLDASLLIVLIDLSRNIYRDSKEWYSPVMVLVSTTQQNGKHGLDAQLVSFSSQVHYHGVPKLKFLTMLFVALIFTMYTGESSLLMPNCRINIFSTTKSLPKRDLLSHLNSRHQLHGAETIHFTSLANMCLLKTCPYTFVCVLWFDTDGLVCLYLWVLHVIHPVRSFLVPVEHSWAN